MLRGAQYSAILHLVILVLLVLGLPDFFKPERNEQPMAISVEILPVADQSNVPNRVKSTPKKKEPKPVPPVKKEVVKPQPPVKKEKAEPEPKPEPVPSPKPEKPKPKKEEVKKEEPKPKPKPEEPKKKDEEEDLMAVLKAVKETAEKQDDSSEAAEETSPSKSDTAYIDSLPLSMSERDAIRNQIAQCWNMPSGAKDAHELVVVLRLTLNQDGSLINAYLHKSQQGRYSSNSFFRAAVDSAMRAVRACTPLKNLPPDKYQSWKDVELTFDPKDMLY